MQSDHVAAYQINPNHAKDNIPESFATHTYEEIYACLEKSGEGSFELLLSRMPLDDEDKNILLVTEYHAALFCRRRQNAALPPPGFQPAAY